MLSVAEAEKRILRGHRPGPSETVPLAGAVGRILARPAKACRTHPPRDVSAMDGYAVRLSDIGPLPVSLKVVAHIPAGHAPDRTLQPGEAARLFTGSIVPDGADAIVIQENTRLEGATVHIVEGRAEQRYIRRAGYDFADGEEILPAGRRITPQDCALAAAAGLSTLAVHRKPTVAFLATGDELVPPGTMPGPSQIIASTGLAIAALIESWGGSAVDLGIARDSLDDIRHLAQKGLSSDVLVAQGGASVGDHDLIKPALDQLGLSVDFWKIAMRPGKPLMSGWIGNTGVLGLPGNPVSALVCAILFLQPLIRVRAGESWSGHRTRLAVLGQPMRANDQRQDYVRAAVAWEGGRLVATPFPVQDSGNLSAFSRAEGLIVRAPHAPEAAEGDPVEIIPVTDRF